MKVEASISGLTTGLKNTEAKDVKFVKATSDIQTLHITWDLEPKPDVHKGVFLKAIDLGAPDPTTFENNLLLFFYQRAKVLGFDETEQPNARYVYSLSLDDDKRLIPLFPSVRSAVRRYDANLGGFEDSMVGVKNTFENMDLILAAPDISQAKCTYKYALLLSAGPSLDEEWEQIKIASDSNRFLIIACDAVVKKALEKGVKPHLIVTTERIPGAEDFLKNISDEDLKGMTLVSTLMAYGVALRNWKGKRAFVVRKDYPSHWYPFKERTVIWSAPSVAPTSLGILGLLQIKDIALLGQDLCLDKSGNSHTKLSGDLTETQKEMERVERERAKEDREVVTTYSGEKRETTNAWNVMRGDLTTVKNQWKMKVVSTSYHGAQIVDVPYQKLADYIHERLEERAGKFLLWERNPHEKVERSALRFKRTQAIGFLKNLEDHLEDYTADQLIELPHFRELCLTSIQRAYVTYLNKRFQKREDKHEDRTLVRAEALSAMREVWEILEKWTATDL